MERGELDAAVVELTRVIEEAERTGQPFFAVDASVHLADALTRSGDPARALEVIESARELAGEDAVLYEVPLERLRAEALIALERPEEALARIEPALASARGQRLAYEEALLLLLIAKASIDNGHLIDEANRILAELGVLPHQLDHRLPSPML
jgi:tetratricopeptide (TPR) repeat protein